ncbi:MAG: TadE/TadG family type IV pilus assembly protein [Desulfovibrionaceae bacterium]
MRGSKRESGGANRMSGMTAVECALLIPIVLMLGLGLLESGNMFSDWLTVHKAAESGARIAATGQGEEEGTRISLIEQEVQRVMGRLPGGAADIVVSSWPTAIASGPGAEDDAGCPCGLVEVRVEYQYEPVTPFLEGILPDVVVMSGSDRKVNEPWERCD